jgi:DNA-binding NtrC family response regulator
MENLVGVSAWTDQIRDSISRVAPFGTSVLITGPTGTGKELIARSLHSCSPRSNSLFIPINCAAVAKDLFASHMFGHVKGAFTGAHFDAMGCLRAANGGTVFLDEIGELELDLQAKLLRVLQERVVVPVGAHAGEPVDVRVVAATNRDLAQEVAAGRFRDDLLFRLNVVTLRAAPLSQRRDDIPVLADHCLARLIEQHGLPAQRLTKDAIDWLRRYAWPGNVRQLQNVLERAAIFADDGVIDAELLRQATADSVPPEIVESDGLSDDSHGTLTGEQSDWPLADRFSTIPALERLNRGFYDRISPHEPWVELADLERHHIFHTLEHTFYNQTAAAGLLGISFRALARKIAKYDIDKSRSRRGRPPQKRARRQPKN